jgi:protease-3
MNQLKGEAMQVWGGLRAGIGAVLLALMVGCGSEETQSIEPVVVNKSPNDNRNYAAVTLDNGLKVLMVSDSETEKSAAALSVGVGAFSDPMDFQGMAHYLEHMLFMGSESFPEPDGYMNFAAENGGSSNAYTSSEITNYMITIENQAFPEALHRLSEFFSAPILDPDYIQKEKNAVNAEWSMRRESEGRSIYRLQRELLGEHPANRFTIGNLETLADKETRQLHPATVEFFEQYYSANLMSLVLISPLPVTEMEALASQYFALIPNKETDKPTVATELDFSEVAGKLIRFKPQRDLREMRISYIIDNNQAEWRSKPGDYLGYVIGSEMPGAPADKLKSLGLISELYTSSYESLYGNYGTFEVSVQLTPQGMKRREEIYDVVTGYIELLRREGVDDRYVEEYRQSLQNRFTFLEKTDDFSYASSLAAAMQDYPIEHVIDAPYRFDGFNQEAVDTLLSQLVAERSNVWFISQEEPTDKELQFYVAPHSVEEWLPRETSAALALVDRLGLTLPSQNALLPERFDIKSPPQVATAVEVADNVTFWLKGSENFEGLPKGFTRIQINTPKAFNDVDSYVYLALWESLYNLKQARLATEASVAGMSLSMSAGSGVSLTMSGFTDKQPELLSRALAGLRVEATELELGQAVERYLRSIENAKRAFPYTRLSPLLGLLTREGQFTDRALALSAAKATLTDLEAFIDATLSGSHLRGFFFGNYDEADVISTYERMAKVVNASPSAGYARADVYDPQPGATYLLNRDVPVEDLGMLYAFAAPEASVKNRALSRILARHLRVRAFETLRTEEQLGYAAGGGSLDLYQHPMVIFYIQTPVKGPQAMLDRFNEYTIEYREELDNLPLDSFEKFKAGVLTSLTEPPKNLSSEAGPFASDWAIENYDFDSRDELVTAVESATLDDVRAFFDSTVFSEERSRLVIQLRGKRFADEAFATLDGGVVVDDIDQFHNEMAVQAR